MAYTAKQCKDNYKTVLQEEMESVLRLSMMHIL